MDHRADLFSLGVVLYELATGRLPFVGASPTEIIDRILHEPPLPSAVRAGIPPRFDAIVEARERSRRSASARDSRPVRALADGADELGTVGTERSDGRVEPDYTGEAASGGIARERGAHGVARIECGDPRRA